MILRVEIQLTFLRQQCNMGIYEIGDSGRVLYSLEVSVSPGIVRSLSTWNHFCCFGSTAFEINPGEPKGKLKCGSPK